MERVVKVFRLDDGQHRPENFFLGDTCMRVNICNDRRLNKEARAMVSTPSYQATFLLTHLDIIGDLLQRVLIDDRSYGYFRLRDIAHVQLLRLLDHLLQYLVIDLVNDDGSRTCRTFLPLEAKCRSDDAGRGCIQVG